MASSADFLIAPSERPLRIGLLAGEASGDQLGVGLMTAILKRHPNTVFYGVGGAKMIGRGLDSWVPIEKLAVRGFSEVLGSLRELFQIRRALLRQFLENPPDVFVGIDAPDFNFGLERALKKKGIPTVHYVSPSIWGWRADRINKIARSVSKILTLFPFEPALYEARKIPVTYVGHPLADIFPVEDQKKAMRDLLKIPEGQPVFAFLPGSSRGELHHMVETFLNTAKALYRRMPEALFLVPFVTRETRDLFETALFIHKAQNYPFRLLFGHAHQAMMASDVVLLASGTAALEAALAKRPMVVAYKMAPMTHTIVRSLYKLPYVSLPNILLSKFVVPEFIQEEATPQNLVQALLNLYHDKAVRAALSEEFTELHLRLKQNADEKAATEVLNMIALYPENQKAESSLS